MNYGGLKQIQILLPLTAVLALGLSGCASTRKLLALDNAKGSGGGLIHNPFVDYDPTRADTSQNVVLRTKKGDRAVEVELPSGTAHLTDFTIPVAPAFAERGGSGSGSRSPAGLDAASPTYRSKPPTLADREITRSFSQAPRETEGERREIEQGLGLMPSEDSAPEASESYLGALDGIKGLYRSGRFEAALVELDSLIGQYPTSPRLYQMRGTLLERVGQPELALKNWKQALQFEPSNLSLRKFVERKEQKRSLASP